MPINFNAPTGTRNQRLETCRKCKFFKPATQSCGTLLIGGTVTPEAEKENSVRHYKAKIKLCGCVMPVKTKLRFASCPAGRWSAFEVKPHEVEELRAFMAEITGKAKIDEQQAARLFAWKSKITGRREQFTTCGACVRELIQEINKQLDAI